MPFIEQKRRKIIEEKGLEGLYNYRENSWIQSGDRCYVYYKQMVDKWRGNPKWTTAHEIYRDMIICYNDKDLFADNYDKNDNYAAACLAWQVFFQLYILPYELEKRKINGEV